MKASEYIANLPTAAERMEASDRYTTWWNWDADTEWSADDESEYNRAVYLGVLAEVELGSDEYTAEDVANYRARAEN